MLGGAVFAVNNPLILTGNTDRAIGGPRSHP